MKESLAPRDFKILVIDHNTQVAANISKILYFHGFKTFESYSFDDSIRIIKEEKPPLIISSWEIGQKKGLDLLKKIKKSKIIFLISESVDASQLKNNAHVADILQKPLDNVDLLKSVRKSLGLLPRAEEVFVCSMSNQV